MNRIACIAALIGALALLPQVAQSKDLASVRNTIQRLNDCAATAAEGVALKGIKPTQAVAAAVNGLVDPRTLNPEEMRIYQRISVLEKQWASSCDRAVEQVTQIQQWLTQTAEKNRPGDDVKQALDEMFAAQKRAAAAISEAYSNPVARALLVRTHAKR
jgi:DNA repair ATPase RecN